MNNHYWYLEVDEDSDFITVGKYKGFIFDKYVFYSRTHKSIMKMIKNKLKKCPPNNIYTFAYDYELKCVGITRSVYLNGVDYLSQISGEHFFDMCVEYDLQTPSYAEGNFVFNTLGENLERDILVRSSNQYCYKLKSNGLTLYPLRAMHTVLDV